MPTWTKPAWYAHCWISVYSSLVGPLLV